MKDSVIGAIRRRFPWRARKRCSAFERPTVIVTVPPVRTRIAARETPPPWAISVPGRRACELDRAEEVRVGIAMALLQEPSLLLVDEPIKGVDPLERDRILQLLGSLAREGASIIITIDNGVGLFAADRALSLGEGRLRGHVSPELAPVVELPLRARG